MSLVPESKRSRIQFTECVYGLLQGRYTPQQIMWGERPTGGFFSSEYLWDTYYASDVETIRKRFMKETDCLLDRHKIIAITQRIILEIQPLTLVQTPSDDERLALNADFAFLFGVQFITRWNEVYYPEQHFQNQNNPFSTSNFLYPLLKTEEGRIFVREHKKLLTTKNQQPLPLFLTAQLWFLIEQWGLTYMRSQNGLPKERSA